MGDMPNEHVAALGQDALSLLYNQQRDQIAALQTQVAQLQQAQHEDADADEDDEMERQDETHDHFQIEMQEFLQSLEYKSVLPVTRQDFTKFEKPDFDHDQHAKTKVPGFASSRYAKVIKAHQTLAASVYRAIAVMKKDTAALATGDYPKPLEAKSSLQFKKEQKETHALRHETTLRARTAEDLQTKIKANKAWIQEKYPVMNARQYFTDFMSELFDELDKHHTPDLDIPYYKAIKAHAFHSVYHKLVANIKSAESAEAEKMHKQQEFTEKKKADAELFDSFAAQHPKASLAVFFRNLEERIITLVRTEHSQQQAAYNRVKKNQALTQLEKQVFHMSAQLKEAGFPFLSSPGCDLQLKKPKVPDKTREPTPARGRTPNKKNKGKGKSPSRTSRQSSSAPKPRRSSRATSTGQSAGSTGASEASSTSNKTSATSKPPPSSRASSAKGKGKGKGRGKGKGKTSKLKPKPAKRK
eukprot:TRINITY_DN22551_c0_g1_i3.p1 TRINITY_DN22551_c0_g1~~TRINITY_DN22551_c0_g1_i3.p1  ORF type:complete len:471 (-),score=113.85 TRINITY_DN22551_c0_g1_i3:782-2194(-)